MVEPVNGNVRKITGYNVVDKRTLVRLKLEGEESAFIVFNRKNQSDNTQSVTAKIINTSGGDVAEATAPQVIVLNTKWQVHLQHTAGEPARFEMETLRSLHEVNSVSTYFSGLANYEKDFTLSSEQLKASQINLRLNQVEEIADVYVNGVKIGTHWFRSQQFNIKPYLRTGENHIAVEVVNSINNALVGDAKKEKQFRMYYSNIQKLPNAWMKPFSEASLLPAGLIGPVELVIYE
jgi:hypothetical protein